MALHCDSSHCACGCRRVSWRRQPQNKLLKKRPNAKPMLPRGKPSHPPSATTAHAVAPHISSASDDSCVHLTASNAACRSPPLPRHTLLVSHAALSQQRHFLTRRSRKEAKTSGRTGCSSRRRSHGAANAHSTQYALKSTATSSQCSQCALNCTVQHCQIHTVQPKRTELHRHPALP